MKLSRWVVALVVTAIVVVAALAVFAVELGRNQSQSRREVETQIQDRAELAASLINSVFNAVIQAAPNPVYLQPTVTAQQLDAVVSSGGNAYAAVLGPDHAVLARSSGLSEAAAAALTRSPAAEQVWKGHRYGLGDLVTGASGPVVDLAAPVRTPSGARTVVTGLRTDSGASAIGRFLTDDLRSIPGVAGETNYVVDGRQRVLASTSSRVPVGAPIPEPGAARALSGSGPDQRGTYFAHVTLRDSRWQIVLAAPDAALFASVTGSSQVVPWVIFAAFALAAAVALLLGWRALRSAQQLQEANGRLAGVNGELSNANAALERRAAELARSNEELDQFASIASHDLQEPLRKVRTFTEQLSVTEAERLSERGRDYLVRANSAAERMQNLIEDLLRFSRVSTQGRPFVPVDLAATARAVVDDLESQIADTGAVVGIGDLPVVEADPLQMQQLLQNLVSNAIKFRRDGVTPEVDLDGSTDGTSATLTVRDNGIGFDQRYAQRIFRIFERLHGRSEYPGTGIGLALCRKIADRHGGTIVAEGEPGAGAVFTVTLPVSQASQQPGRVTAAAREERWAGAPPGGPGEGAGRREATLGSARR